MFRKNAILSPDTLLLLALGSAHLWFNQSSSAILVILMAIYVLLDLVDPPARPREGSAGRWLFLS
jgi:hypothetical protein